MKYVLVTGAYGGMGRATVSALVAQEYGVFALDRQVGEPSENVYPIAADVTDSASLAAAADVVAKVTDKLFAVVHFAGVYMMDSLVEMDESAFRRIVDINLTGAYLVNKTFAHILGNGSRIVITTSELAPLDPLPFTGIYAVTKAALDKYAYSLAGVATAWYQGVCASRRCGANRYVGRVDNGVGQFLCQNSAVHVQCRTVQKHCRQRGSQVGTADKDCHQGNQNSGQT